MEIRQNALVRYGFLKLLEREFDIHIKDGDLERIELAKRCIHIYDSPEAFYKATGWAKDNPEASEFSYLLENRVCSMVAGRVWYFSRLQYEDGLKGMRGNCEGNAMALRRP